VRWYARGATVIRGRLLPREAGRSFEGPARRPRVDEHVRDRRHHRTATADHQPHRQQRHCLVEYRPTPVRARDHWSVDVLLRELTTLYNAFNEGRESPLPELPLQYVDFAVWQRQWLQGEVLERQLAYWKKQLGDDLPVSALPTDRPRPPVRTHRCAKEYLRVPKEVSVALKRISQQNGVTMFMTVLAAFKVLLVRFSGQEDIVIGTPIAGRNRAEVEGLIGFFVNTLVMRTDLSGNPTFRELLKRVRAVSLGAFQHQEFPFEKLVDEIRPGLMGER